MGAINAPITNFTGGRIGRLLAGRVDFPTYPTAGSEFLNLWPIPQGPWQRRPPLKFIAPFVDSAKKGSQIPFNADDFAYNVLATEDGFEFFTQDGKLENEAVSTVISEGDFTFTHPDIADVATLTSSTLASGSVGNLIDENTATKATWNATATGTLTLDFGVGISVTLYDWWLWASDTPNRAPLTFSIDGSATGAFAGEQVSIFQLLGQSNWVAFERRKYRITFPGAYRFYRMSMTSRESGSGDYQLSEISAFNNPWLDRSVGNSVVTPVTGKNFLDSDGASYSITEQLVPILAPGVRHILKFEVLHGPINFRVGTAAGDDDLRGDIDLATGIHYLEFTPPAATNDSFTKMLLHMDGFQNAQVFIDEPAGGTAKTWTVTGNAKIDGAQAVFGDFSGFFDGTGDYITVADHADFTLGSGNWTFRCRFNLAGSDGLQIGLFGQADISVTNASTSIIGFRTSAGNIQCRACVGGAAFNVTTTEQYTSSLNTGWHDLEFSRNGGNLQLRIDGVQQGGDVAIAGTVNDSASVWGIGVMGAAPGGGTWNGWIDEVQLSVGVARHTADFTPSTRAAHTNRVYVQFYHRANAGRIIDNVAFIGTTRYLVDHPYLEEELPELQWQQIGDKLYLTHREYWPRRLERRGHRSWSLVRHLPNDGPLSDINTTAITVAGSAVNGEINLTASEALFDAGDEGVVFRLTGAGQTRTAVATSGDIATAGIKVTGVGSAARTFRYDITGTFVATVTLQRSSGNENDYTDFQIFTVPTSATFFDALDNQTWFYRLVVKAGQYTSGTVNMQLTYAGGSSEGTVRVISVQNPKVATAEVIDTLASTTPVLTWRKSAWNGNERYPSSVAHAYARLWFGRDIELWASRSDNFNSFQDGEDADQAISATLASAGQIRWMASLGHLVIGSSTREMLGVPNTTSQPVGPTNFQTVPGTHRGGQARMPVVADGSVMFMSRTGRRLIQFTQNPKALSETSYVGVDLNELSPDALEEGVVKITMQKNPEPRVYVLLKSGVVKVLLFRRDVGDLGIAAWATINSKRGFIEDVNVTAEPERDAVWFVVRRLVNGVFQRSVQKFGALETVGDGDDYCLDAALSYELRRPNANALASGRTGNITIETDADAFTESDVGAKIWISGGKATITSFVNARKVNASVLFDLGSSGFTTGSVPDEAFLDEFDEPVLAVAGRWGLNQEVSGFSGLSHLEGQQVRVHADAADVGLHTVNAGAIALPVPASHVHIGIDVKGRWRSMKLAYGAQKGTALGQKKAVKSVIFVVDRTGPGIYYGPSYRQMRPLVWPSPVQTGAPPPIVSDELLAGFDGKYENDARMHIEVRGSHPATLLAYVPAMDERDR